MRLEPRVYTLPANGLSSPEGIENENLTDEEFIEKAERIGTVDSLRGFQDRFNHELQDINSMYTTMRILWVEITDDMYGVEVSNYANSETEIDELSIIKL